MMKKTLLSLTLLIFSITAMAQLDKNNWLVGGNGSFYFYNQDFVYPSATGNSKEANINVSATIGYFIMDKLTVGLAPSFSHFKSTTPGGGITNEHQLGIGPFLRYYFLEKEKPFNILSDVTYQLGVNSDGSVNKRTGKYNRFSVMAGPEIFFNSAVGLEVLIGYKATTLSIDNNAQAFSNINKGFQVSIGFQFHLEKL